MIEIKFMVGVKTLEPVKYVISKKTVKRWWWFPRYEYFIETDFCSIGPFDSFNECVYNLGIAGIRAKYIKLIVM